MPQVLLEELIRYFAKIYIKIFLENFNFVEDVNAHDKVIGEPR